MMQTYQIVLLAIAGVIALMWIVGSVRLRSLNRRLYAEQTWRDVIDRAARAEEERDRRERDEGWRHQ